MVLVDICSTGKWRAFFFCTARPTHRDIRVIFTQLWHARALEVSLYPLLLYPAHSPCNPDSRHRGYMCANQQSDDVFIPFFLFSAWDKTLSQCSLLFALLTLEIVLLRKKLAMSYRPYATWTYCIYFLDFRKTKMVAKLRGSIFISVSKMLFDEEMCHKFYSVLESCDAVIVSQSRNDGTLCS